MADRNGVVVLSSRSIFSKEFLTYTEYISGSVLNTGRISIEMGRVETGITV